MISTTLVAMLISLVGMISAIQVTSPDKDTIWKAGEDGMIDWNSVNTDPSQFTVQLVNQAGYLSNSPVTLATDVSTSDSSLKVTYPNGDWPTGHAFQINFISSDPQNSGILAQSNQFNITDDGKNDDNSSGGPTTTSVSSSSTVSGSSSTVSGSSSTTSGSSVTSSSPPSTTSKPVNSDPASSSITPMPVTSTGAAENVLGKPSKFISILISLAGVVGVAM